MVQESIIACLRRRWIRMLLFLHVGLQSWMVQLVIHMYMCTYIYMCENPNCHFGTKILIKHRVHFIQLNVQTYT
jgi:hypothetical protein